MTLSLIFNLSSFLPSFFSFFSPLFSSLFYLNNN